MNHFQDTFGQSGKQEYSEILIVACWRLVALQGQCGDTQLEESLFQFTEQLMNL